MYSHSLPQFFSFRFSSRREPMSGLNTLTNEGLSALDAELSLPTNITLNSQNLAFGAYASALYQCQGNENTAVGVNALYTNTTPSDNTALGFAAQEYANTGAISCSRTSKFVAEVEAAGECVPDSVPC
jgi:hypothetical protein